MTKEMFDLNKLETRTNDRKVLLRKASLEVQKHYITIRAAREGNALPSEVKKNFSTTIGFKNILDNFWR